MRFCQAPTNLIKTGIGQSKYRNLTIFQGRGGDLIVFAGPGIGHLTDLVLPGKGIFESFFARRGDI